MAKKSTNQATNLRGMNIYKDSYGRSIYYDFLTKSGYLITPKDANLYVLYSKRFLIPLLLFIIIYESTIGGRTLGFSESIIVCLAAVMMMEVLFRFHFLKHLTIIPNFKPTSVKGGNIISRMTQDTAKGMLATKAILYFTLSALLIFLAYSESYTGTLFILSMALSAIVAVVGIIYLIGFVKK